jgi:hypothetical protein
VWISAFPKWAETLLAECSRGPPGLEGDGSGDEVRPTESDPIQPCSIFF